MKSHNFSFTLLTRDKEKFKQTLDKLTEENLPIENITNLHAELGNPQEVLGVLENLKKQQKKFDLVINNAGIFPWTQ